MKVKIAVMSPSLSLTSMAADLAPELGIELIYSNASFPDVEVASKKMVETEKAEVIIARGQTAEMIKNTVDIPVLQSNISFIDLLRNLYDASLCNKKIGVVWYDMNPHSFEDCIKEISSILKVKIEVIDYKTVAGLNQSLKLALNQGIEIILGGAYFVNQAKKIGFDATEITTSRETMIETLNYAKQIAILKRTEEQESKWLKALLELTNEGIIAVNDKGLITTINTKAQGYLNCNNSNPTTEPVEKYMPQIKNILDSKQKHKGKIFIINSSHYILNFRPLEVRGQYYGGLIALEKSGDIQMLENKIRTNLAEKGLVAKVDLEEIIGSSKKINTTIAQAQRFGKSSFNILISGESGTGKELFAQGMHRISQRKNGPFVAINCAALPESLLESELFGYEDGAFTGASKGGKPGLFELAHMGTIFLDEIESINTTIQPRLLRVIQEKEVRRLGGNRNIPVNCRIFAATNEPLDTSIDKGVFRIDLYYRINELYLFIPPLRERKEDIPDLIRFIINQFTHNYKALDIDFLDNIIYKFYKAEFSDYYWPGNVRELENFIKRCIVLIADYTSHRNKNHEKILDALKREMSSFALNIYDPSVYKLFNNTMQLTIGSLEEMEKQIIVKMYNNLNCKKTDLAKQLKISRSTLWRKLETLKETGEIS